MTLIRLGDEPAAVPHLAIVGVCTDTVVTHVGLLAERATLLRGEAAGTYHMRPPLRLPDRLAIHLAVWFDDMSDDERDGIELWIAEQRTQAHLIQYWLVPGGNVRDLVTGRSIPRYSCAGFVQEAFREGARLELVDEAAIPAVDRATLEGIWGERAVRIACRFGLTGDGPWTVLLPGYVVRAVAAGRSACPYRPAPSDVAV